MEKTVHKAKLACGTGNIGGAKRYIPKSEAFAIMDAAWAAGIRHFDTATLYGAGRAQTLVGQWLAERQIPRQEVFISTKVARDLVVPDTPINTQNGDVEVWVGGEKYRQKLDYSYAGAQRQFPVCLEQLGVEYVDALMVHDIDRRLNHPHTFDQRLQEVQNGSLQALKAIGKQGLAKKIGVGVNDTLAPEKLIRENAGITCALVAGQYTLIHHTEMLDIFALSGSQDVEFYLGGCLNSGILAGDTPEATYFYGSVPTSVREKVHILSGVCNRYKVPLGAVALQFAGMHPQATTVVLGPDTVDQLQQCVEWYTTEIPTGLWAELRHLGLIEQRVPLPTT